MCGPGGKLKIHYFRWTTTVLVACLLFFYVGALNSIASGDIALKTESGKVVNNNLQGADNKDRMVRLPDVFDLTAPQPDRNTSPFRRRSTVRPNQALSVGGNLLGPTLSYASVFMQYSYGPVIQAEAGIDLATVYGGLNLYPPLLLRVEGLSPYMGLMLGYSDPYRDNIARGLYAYMPIGVRYLTYDDWYISVEFAATTASDVRSSPIFFGLKLGYLFRW